MVLSYNMLQLGVFQTHPLYTLIEAWLYSTPCVAVHHPRSIPEKAYSREILPVESFFPTCQVRVVRFYVSCLLLSSSPLLLLLNRDPRRTVFSVGPQPRPSTPSVPCRTSTTTIPAQCSLPDLNHDHPRPVFPAGPQPRVSTPSVPCRTSCRKIWDKECAEES